MKTKTIVSITASLLLTAAGAQMSSYSNQSTSIANNVAPGNPSNVITQPYSQITICGTPAVISNGVCTNTLPTFKDAAGTQPNMYPILADALGQYQFFINGGGGQQTVCNAQGINCITVPFSVPAVADTALITLPQYGAGCPNGADATRVNPSDCAIQNAINDACARSVNYSGSPLATKVSTGVFRLTSGLTVPACPGFSLVGNPGISILEQDYNAVSLAPVAALRITSVTTAAGISTYSYTVTGGTIPAGLVFVTITGAQTTALNLVRSITSAGAVSASVSYINGALANGSSAVGMDSNVMDQFTGIPETTDQSNYALNNVAQSTITATTNSSGTFTLPTTAAAGTEVETVATATVQNLAITPVLVDSANYTRIQGVAIRPGGYPGLPAGILAQLAISSVSNDANGNFLTYTYTVTAGNTVQVGNTVAVSGATTGNNIQAIVTSVGPGTFTVPYATLTPLCVTACAQTTAVADVRYTTSGIYMNGNTSVWVTDGDFSGFANTALDCESCSDVHIERNTFVNNNGVSINIGGSLHRLWAIENNCDRSQASAPGAGDCLSIKPSLGIPADVFVSYNHCVIGHSFCEETQGLVRRETSQGNIYEVVTSPIISTSTGNALQSCYSRQAMETDSTGDHCKSYNYRPSGYPGFEIFGQGNSYVGWSSVGMGVANYMSESRMSDGMLLGGTYSLTFGNTMGMGGATGNIVANNTISAAGVGPYDVWQPNLRLIFGQRIGICVNTADNSPALSAPNVPYSIAACPAGSVGYVYFMSAQVKNANNYTGATIPTYWGTSFDGGVYGQINPSIVQDFNDQWTLDFIAPTGAYNQVAISCSGFYGYGCGGNKFIGNRFLDVNGGSGSKRSVRFTSGLGAPIRANPSSTVASGGVLTLTVPYTFGTNPVSNGIQGGTPAVGMTATFSGCTNSGLNASTGSTITSYTAPTATNNGTVVFSYSGASFTATTETPGNCVASIVSSAWIANTSVGNEFIDNTFLGCSTGLFQVSNSDGAQTWALNNIATDPNTGTTCPLGTTAAIRQTVPTLQ